MTDNVTPRPKYETNRVRFLNHNPMRDPEVKRRSVETRRRLMAAGKAALAMMATLEAQKDGKSE